MDKFQHKLRTTIHTRSVESIMTRTHAFFDKPSDPKLSPHPKLDNISTFLRKFQIDRENLNLAKRIMDCESEHSRNKYVREWKKTKKFLRVRSNFKPQLSAQEPKIYKFQEIPGQGRLLVRLDFKQLTSHMKQLNAQSLYLLKFNLGGSQLIPNKEFLTLQSSNGYNCTFLAPYFLRSKQIIVKLIKVVENNNFDAGKFVVDLANNSEQQSEILNKMGKVVGHVSMKLQTQVREKSGINNKENSRMGSEIFQREECTDFV